MHQTFQLLHRKGITTSGRTFSALCGHSPNFYTLNADREASPELLAYLAGRVSTSGHWLTASILILRAIKFVCVTCRASRLEEAK